MIEFTIDAVSDQSAVIHINGDLDIDATEAVEQQLMPEIDQYNDVTFDFSSVPFVDSSGMGLLLHMIHSIREQQKQVKIIRVSEDVQIVFDLLQIPDIVGEDVFC